MLDPDLLTFWFPQTGSSTARYVQKGKENYEGETITETCD
jgi:hypothetical protein